MLLLPEGGPGLEEVHEETGRLESCLPVGGGGDDEDGRLAALELEHFPGMAEAEIRRIADEAATRWPVAAITVIHRHGKIAPGENIVLVVTAASHRQAAFEAASFLMDFLKTRAPFWKKEHERSGKTGEWVAAVDEDDRAAARWKRE